MTGFTDGRPSTRKSSSSRHSKRMMLTSQSTLVVSVVQTFIVRSSIRMDGQQLMRAAITGGWGETPLPLCVGHEIIGRFRGSSNNSFSTSYTCNYCYAQVSTSSRVIPLPLDCEFKSHCGSLADFSSNRPCNQGWQQGQGH